MTKEEKYTRNEISRLKLEHFLSIGEERIKIEEPLVVQMIYDQSNYPVPVCINRMLEMIEDEVMKRISKQYDQIKSMSKMWKATPRIEDPDAEVKE